MSIYTLRNWQQIQKDPRNLIVQASATDGSDSWQPFPIGMSYNYVPETPQLGNHAELVLSCFSETTDLRRRPTGLNRRQISKTLSRNGIKNQHIDPTKYFDILPNYKFVVSPEGNGIDCHRHYEALIAGCIPIVEYRAQIEEKYRWCPMLYTQDYSEINNEYLNRMYDEALTKNYDFSKLFLSSYDSPTQQKIRNQGNFWYTRFNGKLFY